MYCLNTYIFFHAHHSVPSDPFRAPDQANARAVVADTVVRIKQRISLLDIFGFEVFEVR